MDTKRNYNLRMTRRREVIVTAVPGIQVETVPQPDGQFETSITFPGHIHLDGVSFTGPDRNKQHVGALALCGVR